MAEDIRDIALAKHSSRVATHLKDDGIFVDALSAARFAMAYAIKFYQRDFDTLDKLDQLGAAYDTSGNNYSVGSVDPDGYILKLMNLLYPGIETPYRYVRIIMCYGLNKIGDLYEAHQFPPVNKNM